MTGIVPAVIAQVALDVPLNTAFDFRLPPGMSATPGTLVVVPFGRTERVGVVVGLAAQSQVPESRMRDVVRVVDDLAALDDRTLELLGFCAQYYQRPLGEALLTSLPPRLRQVRRRRLRLPELHAAPPDPRPGTAPALTAEQADAVSRLRQHLGQFRASLLHGVTGSGKTEVYLQLIEAALVRGERALMLVPEIGLTPQLEGRVRARFPGERIAILHSQLGEGARAMEWVAAQSGSARIVLGTRLAALAPIPGLGLIVIDEEHDASYKQQDGLRYSARDVATRRAQLAGVPVILGSATPSLESWANAEAGRYDLVSLTRRAMPDARLPRVCTVDTRADRPVEGLSNALLRALKDRVARGEQSLVFVNRRGFSPVLFCRACAWHAECTRCSANLVLHREDGRLRCHQCGLARPTPARCGQCGSPDLAPVGHGTQRLEEALHAALPGARIARVDRDVAAHRGTVAATLAKLDAGSLDIVVGTQMLAKGHDFPRLTLVGIVDADAALYAADFRASERLFALLSQVAGRAGRAGTGGEVLIQTDFPGHPLYAAVAAHDYAGFAEACLAERRLASWPPYAHLAILRAESRDKALALAFLRTAARIARGLGSPVEVFDPVPAAVERRAGLERMQLLVRASSRRDLQPFLARWREALDERAERRVRWALDVDPLDT